MKEELVDSKQDTHLCSSHDRLETSLAEKKQKFDDLGKQLRITQDSRQEVLHCAKTAEATLLMS